MKAEEKIEAIYDILDKNCPKDIRFLPKFDEPWKFLFCVIMSAQCTDERVKEVSKVLFEKYPSLESFASANIDELEDVIRPVGLYHAKAQNIINCAKQLIDMGKMPDDMDTLTSLAGVGRKTASCILGDIYRKPAVIVDTHFSRLMQRLGICKNRDPKGQEERIKQILPGDKQYRFSMCANLFARNICKSRNPDCNNCILYHYCASKTY